MALLQNGHAADGSYLESLLPNSIKYTNFRSGTKGRALHGHRAWVCRMHQYDEWLTLSFGARLLQKCHKFSRDISTAYGDSSIRRGQALRRNYAIPQDQPPHFLAGRSAFAIALALEYSRFDHHCGKCTNKV
jgi:hypothetical protein